MKRIGALSAGLVFCITACGGTSTQASPGDAGVADAATPDAGDASASDAGADAAAYPAPHFPLPLLENHGGSVITDMKVVTVTFAGDADRDAKRAFGDSILKGPWWAAVTRGYAINAGSSGGYVELPDTVSNKTIDNETDLIPMLKSLVAAGTLPKPDANTLYALYFPQSTSITILGLTSCQSGAGFGGYHDYAAFDVNGATVYGAYAVMADCGYGFTSVASHEFIEAATDPHPFTTATPPVPFTWYMYNDAWFNAGGAESADLCEGQRAAKEGNDVVARSWVNLAAAASQDPCQPSDPAKIYFNASVETETVKGLHDPSGGPDYDGGGFVVVKRGQTRQVNVVVFSEKPLPHDVTLVAGSRVQSVDPSAVGPIADGVDAKLSTTTANNGTKLTLTLTVSANATPGDFRFYVRAILERTDYHAWPVVLRVE